MYKKFFICLFVFLMLTCMSNNAYAISTQCNAAIIFDLETQTVIYEKNADAKMYPASTTKIMTAIIALELGKLDDKITVDDETPYEIYGSHIALEPGEILTLKDLLYALLLPSANDAAAVIAKHYSGSIDKFVELMNKKASELGCTGTHFVNPHGLHNANHYTTARDLGKIATYAMQNETFREIVKTPRYEIPQTNKKEVRYIITTNNLLLNTSTSYLCIDGKYTTREYEGVIGIKNGYTPEAGNCLVAGAKRNDVTLITVVLKGTGTQLYTDIHNLLNYGFDNYEYKKLIDGNEYVDELKIAGIKKPVPVVTKDAIKIFQAKDNTDKCELKHTLFDISLPIDKGDLVGKIEYVKNGKTIASTDLISTMTVEANSTQAFSDNAKTKSLFSKIISIISAIIIALIIFIIYNRIRRSIIRKKRRLKRKKNIKKI